MIDDCLRFLSASGSPFHATENVRQMLGNKGFQQLQESTNWRQQLTQGRKFYVVRNDSSIIAFKLNNGSSSSKQIKNFAIVAAHTDSPCLKLKPRSIRGQSGYGMVGVQTYGGGLWHTVCLTLYFFNFNMLDT